MHPFPSSRSLALTAVAVALLVSSRAGAAPILGTYQAHGVVVQVGDSANYAHWTNGISVGSSVALNFTLQDNPESAPGVYAYAPVAWNVVAAPQFYYLGGPSAGAGSVELTGNRFDLRVPDGILTFGGTSTGGIQFEFSAIGLSPGTGLRLPSGTATWEALLRDPNGQILLRATSVPEPSTMWLLIGLAFAAASVRAVRLH